ncbi:MAG: ABC transporter permease [Gammaproteobacteria bacterium]|jgi:putative ABC transport system permease protein|nr:ABC transporter permease [Gammaproteobacteria bacterium]MBT3858496.1 ABC transporter permease [Gammaproteobacteria bacterium]MBT3986766.1 ABC transporter permease [Gammaproteobacteria bacterium]MBT4257076.1 ABC transporter permease [Gammaproteobacteria bacterium]MBT4582862.1 ABC transporter permease [Gammaproteobacteria bacterium]
MLLLKLAFRNIFRQRRRSLLTAISMAGGYILCTFSFSLSEGSYNNAISFFTLDHTGHVQIHKEDYLQRPKIHKTIDDPEQLSEILDSREDIAAHTLRVFAPGIAYSDTDNSPAQIIGVDLERERTTSTLEQKVSSGSYIGSDLDSDGYYSAMIGAGLANSLNIGLGDELILISQGADGSVANDIYIVNGIIGNRDSPDRNTVFLPLVAAQEFLSMYGRVHEVSILLNDEGDSRSEASLLQEELQDLSVAPWQVVESTFYQSMQTDKQGNNFSMGVIVFLVFVGVLNTVLMSVLERTREFGVLKAIGSRPTKIALMITLETGLLASLSVLMGLLISLPLIGWFTAVGFELAQPMDVGGIVMSHMTGEMSFYVFAIPLALIVLFALLISIPTGIRAARISPTEAMRST